MGKYVFKSDRISYKEIWKDDFDIFFDMYSNKDIMKYSLNDAYISKEEAEEEFHKIFQINSPHFIAFMDWVDMPIGIIWYYQIASGKEGGIVEINYSLKPEFWRKWFGTEMGKALIKFIFDTTKNHKIIWTCNIENVASSKILQKLGMIQEWISRKWRFKDGRWVDEIQYWLLKEDWNIIKL